MEIYSKMFFYVQREEIKIRRRTIRKIWINII